MRSILEYSKVANRYAEGVCSGKILAPSTVVAACQRHLRDRSREKDADYPYQFDEKKGGRICQFAEAMVHVKGKWARTANGELPFIHLEDWQCFTLSAAFGWLRKADGLRRFREIYEELPRKNAKSTLAAIIALYMAFADDEPGAEAFAGATSIDQANAVFKPAWLMVQNNPEFKAEFDLELGGTPSNPGAIVQLRSGSSFRPIIGKPGDGDSPHCAVVDEYHEHVTPVMYDAMKTGMGARTQPILVVITTAGVDTSGPCYEKHLEAIKVLDGTLENEELFTIIYAAEPEKEWQDFELWKIVNPNFGVSVMEDFLRGQLRNALQNPGDQNINLTKHLGRWMTAGRSWMNMAIWDQRKDESLHLEDFANARCWLGMDLASKIDIASLAFIFEAPWGWAFFCKHYLPEDTIEKSENAHYRKWRDSPQGWLTQTEGAITDYKRIEDDIRDAAKMFSVQALAFDQSESGYLVNNLQQSFTFDCIDVPQGPKHISQPMKEMEAAIYSGQMRHNGDPILTWMMGNVIKKESRSGGPVKSYYPTKQNAKNKIDGVVAGIMALSRFMTVAPSADIKVHFFV